MTWLPNALTILRCVLAFVVGWAILEFMEFSKQLTSMQIIGSALPHESDFLRGDNRKWVAAFGFFAGALLDFLDGWLARRWNAESRFGRLLDPISDKLLVGIPLVSLTVGYWSLGFGLILLIPALAIIGRDLAVTLLRFSPKGGTNAVVSQLAKWKTAAEFGVIAIPLIVFVTAPDLGRTSFPENMLGHFWLVALYLTAALSLYTGYQYVRAAFSKPAP